MTRAVRYPVSFAFRVDEATAATMRDVAAAHGVAPAEWARDVVTVAAGADFNRPPVRRRILHAEILRGYLSELGRTGNNINQIAKTLNIKQLSDWYNVSREDLIRHNFHLLPLLKRSSIAEIVSTNFPEFNWQVSNVFFYE